MMQLSDLAKIARIQGVLSSLSDYQLDVVTLLLGDDGPETRRIVRRAVHGLRSLRRAG
jgi:hypothetical protein